MLPAQDTGGPKSPTNIVSMEKSTRILARPAGVEIHSGGNIFLWPILPWMSSWFSCRKSLVCPLPKYTYPGWPRFNPGRAGGYAIEFFGVCFIVAIYLRWFKEEKCLNVRQKLGTRNVIENLKNLKNYSHSLIQLQKNVWKSDKSWEPGKIIKISKIENF